MFTRRQVMLGAAGSAVGGLVLPPLALAAAPVSPGVPAGTMGEAVLDALPGKKPLIKLSYRPPNYETPASYFKDVLTPNDAFFVRYHLSTIPELDAKTWRLYGRRRGRRANPPSTRSTI